MQNFGRTSVTEFLGDRVVYRNLVPMDGRLPSLEAIRGEIGLPPGRVPRKSEPDYARVIVRLLNRAQELDAPGRAIQRFIFIGDTRLNDATAFDNICQAGSWPGVAFIGSETGQPAKLEMARTAHGYPLYLANRWAALADFEEYCTSIGFPADESTAVVIDLDKTALGARGRNAQVIDQARVQAVRDTVADLLGKAFNQAAFQQAYDQLNQVDFHPFTTDNQDYLAYICLILGSGLYDLDAVVTEVRAGQLVSFSQFIAGVDDRSIDLSPELANIHREIYANVQAGDPTPFKTFRRNEYLATVGRMGSLADTAPLEKLLAEEILITQEVRRLALDLKKQGARLFGLSDKPDEASIPTPELAARGYQPIHRAVTHAVGSLPENLVP